jgi:hypothetical protein
LQPTAGGYRITTVTVSSPRTLQRIELDASGAAIGVPTPLGSFTSSSSGAPSTLALADRSLFALPYDGLTNPYHMRLIQTCP